MIYLVCSCTENYWELARPYLNSLSNLNSEIFPIVFAVGCEPPSWVSDDCALATYTMSEEDNYGATELHSISHGSFLRKIQGPKTDHFIYTDCDMLLQRSLEQSELQCIENMVEHEIAWGFNAPKDNLHLEFQRLGPTMDFNDSFLTEIEDIPCMNAGLIIARRDTYERLYRAYMRFFYIFDGAFKHPARVQWILNAAAESASLRTVEMNKIWHTHFHFGVPENTVNKDGKVYNREQEVLWVHKPERFLNG